MALDPRREARLSPVDIATRGFAHDPLPGYAELRAKCPVSWHPAARCWLVTRHDDAVRLLRDPRLAHFGVLTSWTRIKERYGIDFPTTINIVSHMPFNYEGDRHAVLRRVTARAIAPFADDNALFRSTAERLLASARADGRFDAAEDFGGRLLLEIVADLAQIPLADRPVLRAMSHLSWAIDTALSIANRKRVEAILEPAHQLLVAETKRQVAAGSDSLIGRLYRELPEEGGDRIASTAALISVMLMMGSDALSGTLVQALRALLDPARRRDRPAVPQASWAALSDDALRYAATVDFLTRVVSEEIAFDGMTVGAGEVIVISPLAANHDAAEFGEDADTVTARDQGVGIAFGAGAHLCVGMRMVRNIVREAFGALAAMPRLRIAGPYVPAPGMIIRTAASFPLALDGAP
jgi:cytochrome P450